MSQNDSNHALEKKIEQRRARLERRRLAQRASEGGRKTLEFAREHPVATLAGALALGLAAGAMTAPGRRAGRAAGKAVARKASKHAGILARILREAAIAYGVAALERQLEARRHGDDTQDSPAADRAPLSASEKLRVEARRRLARVRRQSSAALSRDLRQMVWRREGEIEHEPEEHSPTREH